MSGTVYDAKITWFYYADPDYIGYGGGFWVNFEAPDGTTYEWCMTDPQKSNLCGASLPCRLVGEITHSNRFFHHNRCNDQFIHDRCGWFGYNLGFEDQKASKAMLR